MEWLERIGLRAGPRRALAAAPPSAMAGFELAGVEDLGSTIEFRRDRASSMMAAMFGALALFLVAALWFGSFAKQETMRGSVTASTGAVRMTATVAGVVSKVWVKQGDKVKAGQKLLTISPQQSAGGGGSLNEADIAAIQAQRANLVSERERTSSLLDRDATDRASFETDSDSLLSTLQDQARDLQSGIERQKATVAKFQRYVKMGYATRESLLSEERALLEYTRQLAETRSQVTQLSTARTTRQRDLDRANAETRNASSGMTSQIEAIDAKLERLRAGIATDILAPTDGQVATLNVRQGDIADLDQVVAALADPAASIMVALEAPSSAVGLVVPGQRVVLKYDAFPYKTFGIQHGTVVRVGEAPLLLPKTLDPAASINPLRPAQSTFLVEVEPENKTIKAYGVERPILIGSTLSADVVVERRPLIDWVLDPILAVRGRL